MYKDVQSVIDRLLDSFKTYYDIFYQENCEVPLVAVCEYFETSQRYVLSKKAELYSANTEEFIYLFSIQNLTKEIYDKCIGYVNSTWEQKAHIGPGHMYTYITPIFITESADKDAVKLLRKTKFYKSFKLSVWGWMEYHTALFETGSNSIYTNGRGRCAGNTLQKILLGKKNHRRFFK